MTKLNNKRYYRIQPAPKGGLVVLEFWDKTRTKRTEWQSYHSCEELCQTAITRRKHALNGENYLGLRPQYAYVNLLGIGG